jgi:PEP-CTERM motif
MTKSSLLIVAAVAVLLFAPAAFADPIGPDCGSCQGSIYTLLNLGQLDAPGGTTDEYKIDLRIDTSGYTGGGLFIDSVAIKVSSALSGTPSTSLLGFFINGAPSAAISDWAVQAGGLSANGGCDGSGSGFECAHDSTHSAPVPGATYDWIFDVIIPAGTLFTGAGQSSIKVRYVDANDVKVGALASENITLQTGRPPQQVPEPGTILMLSSGLVGLGSLLRRRSRR